MLCIFIDKIYDVTLVKNLELSNIKVNSINVVSKLPQECKLLITLNENENIPFLNISLHSKVILYGRLHFLCSVNCAILYLSMLGPLLFMLYVNRESQPSKC